ncbi:MAG: DEAD/DEAH box helicase [Pseudomonadales bacterium]
MSNKEKEFQSASPEVAQQRFRTIKRFSWSEVNPRLARAMLEALYSQPKYRERLEQLSQLPEKRLAEQALRSFGKQLPDKHIAVVAPVLVEKWLPATKARTVKELATIVQAGLSSSERWEDIGNRQNALSFLRRRRHTKNFLTNLRKAFVSAHKVAEKKAIKPPGEKTVPVPVELTGLGEPRPYQPYRHQIEAREKLTSFIYEAQQQAPGGIVVLPTGAGKTETAVEWLLDILQEEPRARVLWLAHQQELLSQAIDRFEQCAGYRDIGFQRKARTIFGGSSAVTTLAEENLDIAAVTIQSLSRGLKGTKLKALRSFLKRPTYIIVDEVHHAGAPSYRNLLDEISLHEVICFVGLSATPWPTSMLNRFHLRERFPANICEIAPETLMAEGILATPLLHTVNTGQSIYLSESELRFAQSGDLSAETLDRLDSVTRNRRVVSAWLARKAEWGKALVFATNIDHAEELAYLLGEAGANAKTLHSRSEDRDRTLRWFKKSSENVVLVSVGMLTEGVDIPDAKSVFLARPTTSRILLRQMIGRVLRGRKAGGEEFAHVVYFQDEWGNFADILEPPEAIEFDVVESDASDKDGYLPPIIVDDQERPIPKSAQISVKRQFRQLDTRASNAGDEHEPSAIDPGLFSTQLIGYYDLQVLMVAIFEHQLDGFAALQKDALDGAKLTGRSYLSFFDDSRPPYPTQRSLVEFVNFCREFGEPPPFNDLRVTISPSQAADAIVAAGPITEEHRAELIESAWKNTIIRSAIPSLQRFEELVDAQLRERRYAAQRLNAEATIRQPDKTRLKVLPRAERNLAPRVKAAIDIARTVLPPDCAGRLEEVPIVRWSRSVSRSSFGHWSIQLSGRNAGRQKICINRLLRAPAQDVPDKALEYLIYHELLHALLPGQGHDSEFRELEGRWPECEVWDAWFQTLHDRYDIRPERYP